VNLTGKHTAAYVRNRVLARRRCIKMRSDVGLWMERRGRPIALAIRLRDRCAHAHCTVIFVRSFAAARPLYRWRFFQLSQRRRNLRLAYALMRDRSVAYSRDPRDGPLVPFRAVFCASNNLRAVIICDLALFSDSDSKPVGPNHRLCLGCRLATGNKANKDMSLRDRCDLAITLCAINVLTTRAAFPVNRCCLRFSRIKRVFLNRSIDRPTDEKKSRDNIVEKLCRRNNIVISRANLSFRCVTRERANHRRLFSFHQNRRRRREIPAISHPISFDHSTGGIQTRANQGPRSGLISGRCARVQNGIFSPSVPRRLEGANETRTSAGRLPRYISIRK